MSADLAVQYYRDHRRVVEALRLAKCIKVRQALEPKDLSSWLQENATLHELRRRLNSFNIFAALGVSQREIRHSRMLRWLLDPSGSHGQRDRFLRTFIALVTDKKAGKIGSYADFICECEDDRIDILLVNHRAKFVCVIENKIQASQGRTQLRDYRNVIEKRYAGFSQHFVFLTLRGEKPMDRAWVSLDYSSVLNSLKSALATGNTHADSDALALLLAHYGAAIRNRGRSCKQMNVLDILHLAAHELKHSDFLAWLLRPGEAHGLDSRFLEFFLNLLRDKGVAIDESLLASGLKNFQVRREEEDIDIFLLSDDDRTVITIENKILSRESGEQLKRYRDLVAKYYSGERLIHVFLDMKQEAPTCSDYVAISYADLLPFFDMFRYSDTFRPEQEISTLIEHYCALLENHLWIRNKTVVTPASAIVELCSELAETSPTHAAYLLDSVQNWQKGLGNRLEPFLYDAADRHFGCALKATRRPWYTFVPKAFAEIKGLCESGNDAGANGHLARYEFFVIPFGDAVSVRKPGIYLDFHLLSAKPQFESVKRALHESALRDPLLFNRVQCETKIPKFDLLTTYKLCSFDEAVTLSEKEIGFRVERRLARFAASFHQEIVTWFRRELC